MSRYFFYVLFIGVLIGCKKKSEPKPDDGLINIDKSQKAFPTAEGHGAWSKGGRGGDVIYVTTLSPTGTGSISEAIAASGPRTILFAVSGTIDVSSVIQIKNPFVTIDGSTAPGDGVTLKGSGLYISTNDVIIRHLRIRPGDGTGQTPNDRDAIGVGSDAYSIMIDHVSASWSIDELMSTWYSPQYVTFQHCILSEALSNAGHPYGEHSKALLIGDDSKKISVHHNVFAHNNDRNPQFKDGVNCDFVNNIVYNWGEYCFSFAFDATLNPVKGNLMNNYFKKGPSSTGTFFGEPSTDYGSHIYLTGNEGDDSLLLDFNANTQSYLDAKSYLYDHPVDWEANIVIHNIATHFDSILAGAGATLPKRDAIDTRIVNDVKNGTGQIIDSPSEVGGHIVFTSIVLTPAQLDSIDIDRDGMEDSWELANGLDPSDSSDRNGDLDSDGFTNLEEFLHK